MAGLINQDKDLTNSPRVAKEKQYSDLDLVFDARTTSDGDIFKKTDAAAVKQSLKSLLLNQDEIWLTKGSEKYDVYGRTLAYVFDQDDRFINMQMVKLGAAKAMNISPNVEHAHLFNEAEAQASIANVGSNRSC